MVAVHGMVYLRNKRYWKKDVVDFRVAGRPRGYPTARVATLVTLSTRVQPCVLALRVSASDPIFFSDVLYTFPTVAMEDCRYHQSCFDPPEMLLTKIMCCFSHG